MYDALAVGVPRGGHQLPRPHKTRESREGQISAGARRRLAFGEEGERPSVATPPFLERFRPFVSLRFRDTTVHPFVRPTYRMGLPPSPLYPLPLSLPQYMPRFLIEPDSILFAVTTHLTPSKGHSKCFLRVGHLSQSHLTPSHTYLSSLVCYAPPLPSPLPGSVHAYVDAHAFISL